jgi:aminoglycoside phosphotransferase (APT) family kinase protein
VTTDDAELVDRLRWVLMNYWDGRDGAVEAELARLLRPVGPLTASMSVPSGCGEPAAFIKVFSEPTWFQREQIGLRAARSCATTGELTVGVPGVLCSMASAQGLIMERIQGTALSTALRRIYTLPSDRYVTVFRALGRWLAQFHSLDPPDGDATEVLEQNVIFITQNLERAGRLLDHKRQNRARRLSEHLASVVATDQRRLVRCHGDFHPANIMVSNDRLQVVDFAYSKAGYAEHDLVLLRHSLSTNYTDLPFAWRLIGPWWSAFLTAYGYEKATAVSYAIWDLFEMRNQAFYVASDWMGEERTARRKLFRFYRFVLGVRRFRRWIDQRADVWLK